MNSLRSFPRPIQIAAVTNCDVIKRTSSCQDQMGSNRKVAIPATVTFRRRVKNPVDILRRELVTRRDDVDIDLTWSLVLQQSGPCWLGKKLFI